MQMDESKATKESTVTLGLVTGTLILGLAASFVIPNLANAINRGRQKKAMADIRTIGTAIEEYHSNFKSYPAGKSTTISAIETELARAHVYRVPLKDEWGGEYLYNSDGNTFYTITSTGKDRKLDGPTVYRGMIEQFSNDIVFSNGWFTSFPNGGC
jgi:type II secretory pathway pseudopilin PulG